MIDLDRLAREQVFAPRTLDALANGAGVEIWEYSTGQRLEYTTEEQKLMVNIRLFGGGHYVQSITRKTAESLDGKRARGSVVGVAPLGYTTRRETIDGHDDVRYVIDHDHAKLVVRIFELIASKGFSKVANTLNDDDPTRRRTPARARGADRAGSAILVASVRAPASPGATRFSGGGIGRGAEPPSEV